MSSSSASLSEEEEVVHVGGVHWDELSALVGHLRVSSARAVVALFALVTGLLVELHAADWAGVVLLEPVLDALAVESVVAWQLAAFFAFAALLEADVAVRLFAFLFLGQVLEELGGAATALRALLHVWVAHEAGEWVSHAAEERVSEAVEELIHEWVRCLRGLLASHVDARDLRLTIAAVRDCDRACP